MKDEKEVRKKMKRRREGEIPHLFVPVRASFVSLRASAPTPVFGRLISLYVY